MRDRQELDEAEAEMRVKARSDAIDLWKAWRAYDREVAELRDYSSVQDVASAIRLRPVREMAGRADILASGLDYDTPTTCSWVGFLLEDAIEWSDAGFTSAFAVEWLEAGYLPREARERLNAGTPIWGCHCERCESEWVPANKVRYPKVCPKCKNADWHSQQRIPAATDADLFRLPGYHG